MSAERQSGAITLRPYQLLCIVCSLGENDSGPKDGDLKGVLETIREHPDTPITLKCNACEAYEYQAPGTEDDTPEGADYNRKRDLDVLCKLDLVPGATVPARMLFKRLLSQISTVSGICGYGTVTSDAWKGCPRAKSGSYEKVQEKGWEAAIPRRSEEEMEGDKRESLEAMHKAKTTGITIRPHILVCAVCQYGGGTRPPFEPDNLPELMQLILKEPDTLITMAPGADWVMCAPCPGRVAELNSCGNALSNQKRDLDMLQMLGLEYGSTMKARELYCLIFERIPSTRELCKRDNVPPSVWWDGCGEANREKGKPNYEKGREMLMQELK